MRLIISSLLALASSVNAAWFIQEYSGSACTGQRINDIEPFVSGARECHALSVGAGSILLQLNSDDMAYRFRLHDDDNCLDDGIGGANLIPGNDNVCLYATGTQRIEVIPMITVARDAAQPFKA